MLSSLLPSNKQQYEPQEELQVSDGFSSPVCPAEAALI